MTTDTRIVIERPRSGAWKIVLDHFDTNVHAEYEFFGNEGVVSFVHHYFGSPTVKDIVRHIKHKDETCPLCRYGYKGNMNMKERR
jgi:hypothetical protein